MQSNGNTQFISGTYRSRDLTLRYGDFIIPDRWAAFDEKDEQTLTLHQRLAIGQPFVWCRKDSIESLNESELNDFFFDTGSANYINATFGFIVSSEPADKVQVESKNDFFIVAINDSQYLIRGREGIERSETGALIMPSHSEILLFDYLTDHSGIEKIVQNLINLMKKKYSDYTKHRVVAIVLDIHSTRDACVNCQGYYDFQMTYNNPRSFLKLLEKMLEKRNVLIPAIAHQNSAILPSPRIPFATRMSFDRFFETDETNKKHHFICHIENALQKIITDLNINTLEIIMEYIGEFCRDIRTFNNVLLIDVSAKEKYCFSRKSSYLEKGIKKEFLLSKQTIFATVAGHTERKTNMQNEDSSIDMISCTAIKVKVSSPSSIQ
ncbi:hypothetical protein AYO45_05630 [Gammaproteobacteria bacterium SCGC AG-212-F23]|nr:hypothetical protein AYO45_05630 [Gammaproteobacteria bacterium SCGC AG-212-F23]